MNVPTLTAIIIAKNEADKIAACLDSLAFCDERIVVISESTDATADIARVAGARVVMHRFEGFGAQKNYALSLATGDWVLSIDADEQVAPALALEIRDAIAVPRADGYEIPRRSRFLGREMLYSGWNPDHVLRLFRRHGARFSDDLVHERVLCEGPVGRLKESLLHNPVSQIEDALSRMDRYSTAGAQMLVSSGRRVTFMKGITHGLWAFFRTYVLRRGFLDGPEGFLLAVANAEGTYYRYVKAWLLVRHRAHSIKSGNA